MKRGVLQPLAGLAFALAMVACDQKVGESVGSQTDSTTPAARALGEEASALVKPLPNTQTIDASDIFDTGEWDGEYTTSTVKNFRQKSLGKDMRCQLTNSNAESIYKTKKGAVVNGFSSTNLKRASKLRSEIGGEIGQLNDFKSGSWHPFSHTFLVSSNATPKTHAFISQVRLGGKPLYAVDFRHLSSKQDRITFHAYSELNWKDSIFTDRCIQYTGKFAGRLLTTQFNSDFRRNKGPVSWDKFNFSILDENGKVVSAQVARCKIGPNKPQPDPLMFPVVTLKDSKASTENLDLDYHVGAYSAKVFHGGNENFQVTTTAVGISTKKALRDAAEHTHPHFSSGDFCKDGFTGADCHNYK